MILILALGVIAAVQVHLINHLLLAQEEKMRVDLDHDAQRMAEEIGLDVMRIGSAFETHAGIDVPLAQRYERWRSMARDPRLIAAVFEVEGDTLQRLDMTRRTLVPAAWTPSMEQFRGDGPPMMPIMDTGLPAIVLRDFDGKRIVIFLDANDLLQSLAPATAKRIFATDDPSGFDIAIVRHDAIAYRSNAAWPVRVRDADPDLAWALLPLRHRGDEPADPGWTVLARHHGQRLALLIAATRHRDIALASAILLLLGASVIVLAMLARRAERLRLQQIEFVAGITHELHTPLAALASAGQNLADGVPVDTAKYGAAIVKEARRLTDLVDEVLQFGGMQSRSARAHEAVDVRAAIDDAVAQCRWLAEERGVGIECDFAPALHAVRGDRTAITRALQNLIANAIRHGGDGRWVGVRAADENERVAITVEDRGPGIPAADIAHVFEPFYRGRNAQVRGSGLGLTIVDRVARAHGGTIEVAKRREAGAAFTLRLPAA